LSQVHRAVTKSGKEVAVKLQYPGLEKQVEKDMKTMRLLAYLLGSYFPEYQYTWLFPEFEESISLELDFIQEGTNAERVSRMFRDRSDVTVPTIHWDYSTRRVLTMDFIRGLKITDRQGIEEQGMDPSEVAHTVTRTFGDMIHCHGFVHCDPHPGNLMVQVLPSGDDRGEGGSEAVQANGGREIGQSKGKVKHQVVVLDHGMYRRLDPGFRHTYCRLWKAFLTRDSQLGKTCAMEMGVEPHLYEALSLILTWRPANTTAG
ncbi:unnamed protein product, partial [Discosporangium mesarthrocarpum]